MIKLSYPLILASNSPRRKELLQMLKLPFTVNSVEVDEIIPTNIPLKEAAKFLAEIKSKAHQHLATNSIVVTADTIVLLNNTILGKPSSSAEATNMLQQLSDKTHEVITGVCLRCNNEVITFDIITKVTFEKLEQDEIEYYVSSGEANDKAGAYGIQDWIGMIGIKAIEGCYYNVVGLPVNELYNQLKKHFIHK